MEDVKILKDKDIIFFYEYLNEYENHLKEEYGKFDIYNEDIIKFRSENDLFLGSVNRKDDKKEAEKFKNYILWKEGSLRRKNTKVDRAHALLRRIRNAFAHGNLVDRWDGSFKIKDVDDKGVTLDGVVSYSLLYQLIGKLKETINKN